MPLTFSFPEENIFALIFCSVFVGKMNKCAKKSDIWNFAFFSKEWIILFFCHKEGDKVWYNIKANKNAWKNKVRLLYDWSILSKFHHFIKDEIPL